MSLTGHTTITFFCFLLVGPPTINYISKSQTTFEGNKTSLTCNATNDEDAVESLQILWYNTKDKVLITGQQDAIEKSTIDIITGLQSTIAFDPISRNDDGEYTCKAFNHPQLYSELTTSVAVECKSQAIYICNCTFGVYVTEWYYIVFVIIHIEMAVYT